MSAITDRPTLNRELASAHWDALNGATQAIREAGIYRGIELLAVTNPVDQARCERYVRACMVTQGLAG